MIDDAPPRSLCAHLLAVPDDYYVWFTGTGLERDWVCENCAARSPEPPPLSAVPDGWWEAHRAEVYRRGAVGRPEVRVRATALRFTHRDVPLPLDAAPVDIQPCDATPSSWWFLMAGGDLVRVDLATAQITRALSPIDPGFAVTEQCGLCLSPADDYAVVFEASGPRGAVIDLRDGRVVRRLVRSTYRPENSLFPVAFARRDGRTLLVTGSEWNRLELIDVADDRLLSEREPVVYARGQPRPPHYLDYFHGSLSVSPDGARVADSGWVWAPVGVVRAWSLERWLENPWESEDGASLRTFANRDYYWDGPVCWLDATTLVVWGWGDDDEWLVPAALLYDVRDGALLRWFAGPKVRSPRAWPPRVLADSLVFDGYLFAIHDQVGTTVWDVATGERVHADATLTPVRYHRGAREFVSRIPGGVRCSRLLQD